MVHPERVLTPEAFETTPVQVVDGLDPKSKALPLKFSLSLSKLPAGEYSIGRAQQGNGDGLLLISSLDSHSNTFRITSSVTTLDPKDKGTLVFHRYGDEYFLSQVWAAGASTGRMFSESRGEREAKARTSTDKMAMKAGTVTAVDGPQ